MSIEIVITYPQPKMPAGLEMEECVEQVRERRLDVLCEIFRHRPYRTYSEEAVGKFGSPYLHFEHDERVTERTITVDVSGDDETKEAFDRSGLREEIQENVMGLLGQEEKDLRDDVLVEDTFPCFIKNCEVLEVIDLLDDEDDPDSVVGTCEKLHVRFEFGGEGTVYVAYYPQHCRGGVAFDRVPDGSYAIETWGYAKSLDETLELWERNLLRI